MRVVWSKTGVSLDPLVDELKTAPVPTLGHSLSPA